MILPVEPVTEVSLSPRRLVIFSHPKVGKTSLLAQLPNNLILDFESGTSFVQGLKVNVVENARAANKSILAYIKEDIEPALKASKHVYDYITIDTATALEPIARDLGLILYRQTPMGKSFTGNNVLDLPQGGG